MPTTLETLVNRVYGASSTLTSQVSIANFQRLTGEYIKELEKDAAKKRIVNDFQNLNILELATLWHLPSEKIKTPGLLWGTAVLSEPPYNLPASQGMDDAEKQKVNFF